MTQKKKEKQAVLPSSVKSTETDLLQAEMLLAVRNSNSYVVRYLRHEPTVGLATVPIRRKDGTIAMMKGTDGAPVEVPWVRKRVICSGIPYACMIAFLHQDKLLIGWSKRMEDRHLIETQNLHKLFKSAMHSVAETSNNYQNLFNEFSVKLMEFLTCQRPEDIEVAFSKKSGKIAAVIRSLNDTISINKDNFAESAASGPVPHDIAKNLPWFIDHVEKAYGGKAANVSYPELAVAKAENTLPAKV